MLLLATAVLALAGVCHGQLRWTGDTILVPGRIKNPEAFKAAHAEKVDHSNALASAVLRRDGSLTADTLVGRNLDLVDRQTCPPTHPCKPRPL